MKRSNEDVEGGAGSDGEFLRSVEQLAALGHPVRLSILRFVVEAGAGGVAAGEIQAEVEVPASTLSHHLKRLADAGLVVARPEATFIYYAADFVALRALTDFLWKDCCKRGKPAARPSDSGGCC